MVEIISCFGIRHMRMEFCYLIGCHGVPLQGTIMAKELFVNENCTEVQ